MRLGKIFTRHIHSWVRMMVFSELFERHKNDDFRINWLEQ